MRLGHDARSAIGAGCVVIVQVARGRVVALAGDIARGDDLADGTELFMINIHAVVNWMA